MHHHTRHEQKFNDGKERYHYYCTKLLFLIKKKISWSSVFRPRVFPSCPPKKQEWYRDIDVLKNKSETRPHKEILFFCKPEPNKQKTKNS